MIETIGIIGAGTMGNGIAQVSAAAGLKVTMIDIADAAVARGMATITGSLERLVNKQKMTDADRQAALARITATTDNGRLANCDLVIEAATEREDLKVKILKDLCATLQPASDHRYQHLLDLDHEARRRDRPSGPLHRHAFLQSGAADGAAGIDPRLADLRRHPRQGGSVCEAGRQGADHGEEQPGLCGQPHPVPDDQRGDLCAAGGIATAEDIDAGMKLGCNHPIGPLALADMIGLDTMLSVMEVFYQGFNDPKYRAAPAAEGNGRRRPSRPQDRPGVYSYGKTA